MAGNPSAFRFRPPRNGDKNEVTISGHEHAETTGDNEQDREVQVRVQFEKNPKNRITVPAVLESPHPLVERAARSLSNAKVEDNGILRPRAQKRVDIRVSPGSRDRALRIMDALIKALEARGMPVTLTEDGQSMTRVEVLGETLNFWLDEKLRCEEKRLTLAEERDREKYLFLFRRPGYVYHPTGILRLTIGDFGSLGLRRSWGDSGTGRLEDRLNAFVSGLVKASVRKKAERLERERRERERREEMRRREECARLHREEEARVKALEEHAASWKKSQEIRAYIQAVKEAAVRQQGQIPEGSGLEKWLKWASGQTDRLDPVAKSPPSIPEEDG